MGGAPGAALYGHVISAAPYIQEPETPGEVQREQEPMATENMVLDNVANILVDIMVRHTFFIL